MILKQFRLWLVLPLVLCVLVWGLKWRADQQPTELDLKIRALMLKSSAMEIVHSSGIPTEIEPAIGFPAYRTKLSSSELKPFAETFFLSSERDTSSIVLSQNGMLSFSCRGTDKEGSVESVLVEIYLDVLKTRVAVHQSNNNSAEYDLHPVVAKRWLELLLAHPKIGPELRRRIQR